MPDPQTRPGGMTPEAATALRRPFPPESVGVLPKPNRADAPKGDCPVCGGWHGLPAVHLDYVGHAAVTDRLLTVDPTWSWEPLALGPDGLPALDRAGNLWIRLTICGVTRLGVGDGKNAKECIGDAIRNAAMRFGVGLDLWAKENLVEFAQAAAGPSPSAPDPLHVAQERLWRTWCTTQGNDDPQLLRDAFHEHTPDVDLDQATADQLDAYAEHLERLEQAPDAKNVRAMHAAYRAAGITDRDARLAHMTATLGRPVTTSAGLTAAEVATIAHTLATAPTTTTGDTP